MTSTCLIVGGGILEVGGLVITAVGLGQAWAENPHPQSLTSRIFGPLIRFIAYKILRRPRPATKIAMAGATGRLDLFARGTAAAGLDPNASTDEHMAQVKQEVDAASRRAEQAHRLAEQAVERIGDLETRLATEVERLRTETVRPGRLMRLTRFRSRWSGSLPPPSACSSG